MTRNDSGAAPAGAGTTSPGEGGQQRRTIGLVSLLMTGVGTIIGSGWLFGAAHAAGYAGPAAIFSWIIGAFIIALTALTLCELGPMMPRTGGMGRFAKLSHGSLVGFIGDWAGFVGFTSTVPSEASASVQYMSNWDYPWAHELFSSQTQSLSHTGLLVASVLCVVYFMLCYWSMQVFLRAVKAVTLFKIFVPLFSAGTLIYLGFNASNFSAVGNGSIAPYGWSGALTAVTGAGIVYAFNGFQTPISFAGEAKNPNRTIPIAVLGSLALCLVIYVVLQVAFIGALPPSQLAAGGGWSGLDFRSPFADLAISLNLSLLAMLLYLDAFVSPSGSGVIYLASASRMLWGMERDGHMPKSMGRLHKHTLLPRPAMWAVLAASIACLWVFPSWDELAAVISVGYVIGYLCAPVAFIALRGLAPNAVRPVRLPFASVLAPVTFIAVSLLLYWSSWPLTGEVIFIIVAGLGFWIYYEAKTGFHDIGRQLKAGAWFPTYLVTMAAISYVGSPRFGGLGLLSEMGSFAVVIVVSLGFYVWSYRSAWLTPEAAQLNAGIEPGGS